MKQLIGKKVSIFFPTENPVPWSEISVTGEIINIIKCDKDELLAVKVDDIILLIDTRYEGDTFKDISENPLIVHVEKYIGNNEMRNDIISPHEFVHLGIATIRFID